jgi:subtilisin
MKKTIMILTILACLLTIGQGYAEQNSELNNSKFNDNITTQSNNKLDHLELTDKTNDHRIPVIIMYKNNRGQLQVQSDRNKLIHEKGGKVTYEFRLINGVAAELPVKVIEEFSKNKDILYIQPDLEVFAHDQEITWGVQRVNAPEVHSATKGAGVKIAILDSGIDYTHPDLDNNYQGGFDFVNYDNDPMDDHGHGTKVAGIIAAEDNNFGVLGVAPEASIYGVKVLNSGGSGSTSTVIKGIEWAVENDMDIISMSLGGTSGYHAYEAAINNAYNSGVLLIASAGNYGSKATDNVAYPAKYNSVIAVSAINQNDNICSFSSVGPAVELTAPGLFVTSTKMGGGYKYFSGTSAAAPFVSGVAALMIASDPTLTNVEVRQSLQKNSVDLGVKGRDNKYGYGIPMPAINTPPLNIAITAQPDILVSGQNSQITIHIDSSGEPIPDALVTISVSDGTFNLNSGYTDKNGNLKLTYFAPQVTTPSTITISTNVIKSGNNEGTASSTITVNPLMPQIETSMTIDTKILESNQNTNVMVYISSSGIPVSGATVDISATGGYLDQIIGITDTNGDFMTVYTAPQVTSPTTVILKTDVNKSGYEGSSIQDFLSINPQASNYLAESLHPYPAFSDNTWTIKEPGTGQVRIHFLRLETEDLYDFVYIYDKNDVEIARYDGKNNNLWTPWVEGDTIKVRLKSDSAVDGFGFIVDQMETRSTLPQLDVTLTAGSNTLESDKCTQVTVHVSNGGNPVSNADVELSAFKGGIYPASGTTDINGDFSATYTAPEVNSKTTAILSVTADKVGYEVGSDSSTINVNPKSETILAESKHPYSNYYYKTWTITEPGADQVRLHFSRLETQSEHDYVYILNKNNARIAKYDGCQNDQWTPWVKGDTIKVKLITDGYVTDFGFIVDQKEIGGKLPKLETTITKDSEILKSGQNTQIKVLVLSNQNPVSGATVDISTSDGDINPETGITNVNGEFISTYSAPDLTSKTTMILSARSAKIGYSSGSDSCTVEVNPSITTLPQLETTITGALKSLKSGQNTQVKTHVSSNGNPVSGALVSISTSEGNLDPIIGTTDNNGNLFSTFTAPEVTSKTIVTLSASATMTGYNRSSGSNTIIVDPLINTILAESQHPYPNYYYRTWTISESGASQIRVHFTRIDTQTGHDFVLIQDKYRRTVTRYDGSHNDVWTPWVNGDTIKVKLISDGDLSDFGFAVDQKETKN